MSWTQGPPSVCYVCGGPAPAVEPGERERCEVCWRKHVATTAQEAALARMDRRKRKIDPLNGRRR